MTRTKLWILTIVLLIIHLSIQYIFYTHPENFYTIEILNSVTDLISNIVLVFFLGAFTGGLLAFFLSKEKKYLQKFSFTFPFMTSAFLVVLIPLFCFTFYRDKEKGKLFQRTVRYENIRTPFGLTCASLRNGRYEAGDFIVERQGNYQVHRHKKTGKKREFEVMWISDCEYRLTLLSDTTDIIRVKITAVHENDYGCYVLSDKNESRSPHFTVVKRIP